jgi:hypothetical protein
MYARQLGQRLGVRVTVVDDFSISWRRHAPVPVYSAPPLSPWPGIDTVICLHVSPGVLLRDWAAGWFDRALNGAAGRARQPMRARASDVLRALLPLSEHLRAAGCGSAGRVLEVRTPAQASFWLMLEEERRRQNL